MALFLAPRIYAADLQAFLKSCAYGTAGGAVAGVVTLAFTDKPSENGRNVAKGASLGLYAGIIYGLVQMNKSPTAKEPLSDYAVIPLLSDNRVDGAFVQVSVLNF